MSEVVARVSPTSVVLYRKGKAPENNAESLAKARAAIAENGYNGEMNERTAAKVRRYARGWFTARKSEAGNLSLSDKAIASRYTFVTLTLPGQQTHTDAEIRREALRPMLQQLRRVHGARHYLWKAEPQANGNIHFHVLLDVRIPWREIRTLWNGYMERMGYVEQYRQRMKERHKDGFRFSQQEAARRPFEVQHRAYVEGLKTNWSDPNSTDIHALRQTKQVLAYITSYICKKGGRRKIEGRIWDCSDTLRELPMMEVPEDGRITTALREMGEGYGLQKMKLDQVVVHSGNVMAFLLQELPDLHGELLTHWQGLQLSDTLAEDYVSSRTLNGLRRCTEKEPEPGYYWQPTPPQE